jgi:ABC-type sugar transport system substrate-binding protein
MALSESKSRRFPAAMWVAALAITTTALGACSSSGGASDKTNAASSSPTTGSTTSGTTTNFDAELAPYLKEPTQLPTLPAITKPVPKGKDVYIVYGGAGPQQTIVTAAEEAISALGWKSHSVTYNLSNPASGNSAILGALNSGADAILDNGLPAASIQPALAAAKAKNVPVLEVSGTDPLSTPDILQVGQSQVSATAWAKAMALAVMSDAQKRKVTPHVVVVGANGSDLSKIFEDADIKAIKDLCPKCEANSNNLSPGDFVAGEAPSTTLSYIQSHPDTNYVLVIGFPGAMRSVLDSAGLNKVQIGGEVSTPSNLQGVKSGDFFFWLASGDGFVGALGVDALVRIFTGADTTAVQKLPVPSWIVTKTSNIPANGTPDFPTGYAAAFKRLWNVS